MVAGVTLVSSDERRDKIITFMQHQESKGVIDHHAATTINVVGTVLLLITNCVYYDTLLSLSQLIA